MINSTRPVATPVRLLAATLIGAILLPTCFAAFPDSELNISQAAGAVRNLMRIMPADGSSFLVGQRFDIRVEGSAGAKGPLRVTLDGRDIREWNNRNHLTGNTIDHQPAPPLQGGAVFISRQWSFPRPGLHQIRAEAGNAEALEVNFEIVGWEGKGSRVRNVILLIGDGMGMAHRTAARIASRGLTEGRYRNGLLEMDQMTAVGLVTTSSLSAMVTDSAPGASCYATGNKAANQEEGVFPDNTDSDELKSSDPENDRFLDNPRVENISEYLHRTRGIEVGLVTTADVTDATPAAFAVHTSNRNSSTRIADDYFDRRNETGLSVLMGGGRQWFLPKNAGGRRRGTPTNAHVDPSRDLVRNFREAGFTYADSAESLRKINPEKERRLLGLFSPSTMPVAFDKLGYGVERIRNVPMLDDMARAAIGSLSASNPNGFFLMVEGASIDKEAHWMDAERTIWETIEFDRAVGVAKRFAEKTNSDANPNNDTLVIVTADHETSGFSIIGARNPDPRIPRGSRDLARTYRGFPDYKDVDGDGYPDQADPPAKLVIGYGAGADHYEDWHSNGRKAPPAIWNEGVVVGNPKRDGPEDPDPKSRDGTLITGQVENGEATSKAPDGDIDGTVNAVHTAVDIPLTATGPGALQFMGVQDNTSVFFKMMKSYGGLFQRVYYDGRPSIKHRPKK
ncbi:MAG TPA: alkaline phosphatase [Pyrinomonadaceae bacterium]